MNHLEPNSKYLKHFTKYLVRTFLQTKRSQNEHPIWRFVLAWCHFEVHFRAISTKFIPYIFRIICVGKRQYHCGKWTFGNSIIPLASSIFQSLRPSNILLHYFPKILIICLSTKPCFLSSPVSRFARSMFYFAVQVSAHLWAVSDRSWDTSKYLKGLAQKFKFFEGIWWLCATFR